MTLKCTHRGNQIQCPKGIAVCAASRKIFHLCCLGVEYEYPLGGGWMCPNCNVDEHLDLVDGDAAQAEEWRA